MYQTRFFALGGTLVLAVLALAGCSSANAARATTSPTATCPPAPKQALGTVATVNGNSLTVKTTRGQSVTVNLASTTTLIQEATGSQSDLQDGERVQVFVTSNPDGSYTAQRITIAPAGTLATGVPGGGRGGGRGSGGGSGSSNPCVSRTPRAGSGTPGTGRGRPGGGTGTPGTGNGQANGRSVSGTVATINGQVLSVTASDGTDYTVQLDSATKYTRISVAKASDLQVGQAVSVTGRAASNGSITAQSIIILEALPTTPGGQA
jgi:hypothetical protein